MNVEKELVGKRIQDIRLENNWTMKDFGEKINPSKPVTEGIISRWENGVSIPSAKRLKKIAEIGNTTVEGLLYGSRDFIIENFYEKFWADKASDRNADTKYLIAYLNQMREEFWSAAENYEELDYIKLKIIFDSICDKYEKIVVQESSIATVICSNLNHTISNYLNENNLYSEDIKPIFDLTKKYYEDLSLLCDDKIKIQDEIRNLSQMKMFKSKGYRDYMYRRFNKKNN
ncbi:helix-turn-helix domain-containing protein [Aerococcaceae bacterium NML160702]|nr:helix-turn-helix domain-containing protein [Aerococcaceae bacterium NML160702]